MRKSTVFLIALLCLLGTAGSYAQQQHSSGDSTGLPGDNFSLQGALSMFKKATSPEDLEKLINTQSNGINNLDLNGDGNIDYIKVISKKENDVNLFILQAQVSASENQDIAVIELEKTGTENAMVQIVGDEDIYGDTTIVEPADEGATSFNDDAHTLTNTHGPNPSFSPYGPAAIGIVVNVWAWPCVRYVYAPAYVPWVSPWTWYSRPVWWHPWRPLVWTAYRPVRYRYYRGCAVVHTQRIVVARTIYRPVRVTSVTVRTRNQVAVTHYRTTHTTVRRTTTTVNGPRGHYQATRRTTTVQGPRGGEVHHSRTTVRGRRH